MSFSKLGILNLVLIFSILNYMDEQFLLKDKRAYLDELKQKKNRLLEEKKKLISKIKRGHFQTYCWLTEHRVDLENLKPFLAKLMLALAVTTSAFAHTGIYAKTSPDVWLEPVVPLEAENLQGLNEDQKAALVWERYGETIKRTALAYQVDPRLIFATIMTESMGNAYAIRYEPRINDASYGLGQILYGTARLIGFEGSAAELYIPEVNIDLIARYHRRNIDTYGPQLSTNQLAVAYNAGSPYNYAAYGYTAKIDKWLAKALTP